MEGTGEGIGDGVKARLIGVESTRELVYSGNLHVCSANCLRRLSRASVVRLNELKGALKVLKHAAQTASAGVAPSHLVTRRLRLSIVEASRNDSILFASLVLTLDSSIALR